MAVAGRSRRTSLGLVFLAGCSQGVPGTTATETFGPPPATSGNTSNATAPFDPTTGGNGVLTDGATTEPPVDDSTGDPISTTSDGTTTSDGSTGPGTVCGDDVVQGTEECDGSDLGNMTCADVDPMSTAGTLSCNVDCTFDASGCTAVAGPIEMCQVANLAIPDNDVTGVTDTMTLPAEFAGLAITDVDVRVDLVHTFVGDLEIQVASGGTSALVMSDECGTSEDLDVTFDDEGGAAIDCDATNVGATVTPFSPLTGFDGDSLSTDWSLTVQDLAGIDTGTITEWCLTISV